MIQVDHANGGSVVVDIAGFLKNDGEAGGIFDEVIRKACHIC